MSEDGILDVLRQLGFATSSKLSGEWVACNCPLARWTHSKGMDRRSSFGISVNPNGPSKYNCFTCHERGSLTSLIQKIASLSGENLNHIIQQVNDGDMPNGFSPWVAEPGAKRRELVWEPMDYDMFNSVFPKAWSEMEARRYLMSRRITPAICELMDLRYDSYEHRIVFKVMRDDELVGLTGRSIVPDHLYKVKNYNNFKPHSFLLGEELIIHPEGSKVPIAVVEGQFDYARCHQNNIREYADCVGLFGSDMSYYQAERLVSFGRPIVLLLDNDKAGRDGIYGKLKVGSVRRMGGALKSLGGRVPSRVAAYPQGKIQPDELTPKELHSVITFSGALRGWKPFVY